MFNIGQVANEKPLGHASAQPGRLPVNAVLYAYGNSSIYAVGPSTDNQHATSASLATGADLTVVPASAANQFMITAIVIVAVVAGRWTIHGTTNVYFDMALLANTPLVLTMPIPGIPSKETNALIAVKNQTGSTSAVFCSLYGFYFTP